ncbi:hypothetical protein COF80_27045 [Bacillus toyonensis]|uniref:hypothetical protein n=1 Tax=Bacillus toyonensis TaxID=155322 RepID=UPI000BFD865B|nr:hypothetical protein [Bacillus toyonensis]PHE82685.1 hypothetical protein COF80_27045 [Bacillus toyonensis]
MSVCNHFPTYFGLMLQTDLKELFQSFQDNAIIASLINKLKEKKRQIQNELTATEAEIDFLKKKKRDYINLYTEEVITKVELREYQTLAD